MFIDSSAIVAILTRQPGYEDLVRRLEDTKGKLFTSPVARFEATMCLARMRSGPNGKPSPELLQQSEEHVKLFVDTVAARDIHISGSIGDAAIRAAAEYGKVAGHPADLNLGDCFAYACAKAYRIKLVYKGDDFAKTDLA